MDGVLAHQRLTATGGSAHHYRVTLVQRVDRLELEGVEGEEEDRGQSWLTESIRAHKENQQKPRRFSRLQQRILKTT
jgi:hypothetical protein